MEKKTLQVFQSEAEALTKLFTAEDNIDNLKQSIVKSFGKIDENTRSYLQNLKLRKMQFEEERQRAQDAREALLREIDSIPKTQFPYQYCMSLFEKEHTKIVAKQPKLRKTCSLNVREVRLRTPSSTSPGRTCS